MWKRKKKNLLLIHRKKCVRLGESADHTADRTDHRPPGRDFVFIVRAWNRYLYSIYPGIVQSVWPDGRHSSCDRVVYSYGDHAADHKGICETRTVVCAFCGGPIIDLFTWMLGRFINESAGMPVRVVSMVAGCVILSAGMSVVINSNAGTGPNDLVAVILSDKIERVQFRWVRVGCDLFFVVLGFILGGTVGAGTIVAVFLTGPLVQFWLPKTKKAVQTVLQEE